MKGGGGNRLDERYYSRADRLPGTNWNESAFKFKTATGEANGQVREIQEDIPRAG